MAKKEKKSKELVKVEPSKPLSRIEEMERWFEDFFRRPFPLIIPRWWPGLMMPEIEEITPTVDIYEEGDDVVVKAELPGMRKEDIDVRLAEDTITVSGEKKKRKRSKERIITVWSVHMALLPVLFVCQRKCRQKRLRQNSKMVSLR